MTLKYLETANPGITEKLKNMDHLLADIFQVTELEVPKIQKGLFGATSV